MPASKFLILNDIKIIDYLGTTRIARYYDEPITSLRELVEWRNREYAKYTNPLLVSQQIKHTVKNKQ
jgi:hypothetical protein